MGPSATSCSNGHLNPAGSRFCGECGVRLSEQPDPTPTTTAPAAVSGGTGEPALNSTGEPTTGWLPDPSGTHEYRYRDSTGWTDHISDGGRDRKSVV